MPSKILHTGILVSSLEPAVKFYCNVFGFKKEKSFPLAANMMKELFGVNCPASIEVLSSGSGSLELFMLEGAPQEKPRSLGFAVSHIAIEVEAGGFDACLERIRAAGCRVKAVNKEGRILFFAHDPSGNLIEMKSGK